jgi:hypothetical protein
MINPQDFVIENAQKMNSRKFWEHADAEFSEKFLDDSVSSLSEKVCFCVCCGHLLFPHCLDKNGLVW